MKKSECVEGLVQDKKKEQEKSKKKPSERQKSNHMQRDGEGI